MFYWFLFIVLCLLSLIIVEYVPFKQKNAALQVTLDLIWTREKISQEYNRIHTSVASLLTRFVDPIKVWSEKLKSAVSRRFLHRLLPEYFKKLAEQDGRFNMYCRIHGRDDHSRKFAEQINDRDVIIAAKFNLISSVTPASQQRYRDKYEHASNKRDGSQALSSLCRNLAWLRGFSGDFVHS